MSTESCPAPPCEILAWDSAFFGFTVARTLVADPDARGVAEILEWCRDQGVRCLFHLSDANSTTSNAAVEANGFFLVDIRHELEGPVPLMEKTTVPVPRQVSIQKFPAVDDARLRQVARGAFAGSRFTNDTRFPRDRVDALCDEWLVRAGSRGEVFAAKVGDVLAGLVTCEREGDAARVGVLAVEPPYRSVGIGSGLLNVAADWARRHGFEKVRVTTQGGNADALKVYESAGFRTTAVHVWHHRWF